MKNKIVNLIIDSGTYGNRTRLLVKVARPRFTTESSFESSFSLSDDFINKKKFIIEKKNSKLSKLNAVHLSENIVWASPCSNYILPKGNIYLKQVSARNATKMISKHNLDGSQDCFVDDCSPFLLRSYESVKTSDDYISTISDCIRIVKHFKGEVGSITGDQLPVQRKVLSTWNNSYLNSILNVELRNSSMERKEIDDGIGSSESNLINFLNVSFSKQQTENHSNSQKISSPPSILKTINSNFLPSSIMIPEHMLQEEISPITFSTPTCNRNNNSQITENAFNEKENLIVPFFYACNCHLMHTSFRHSLKNNENGNKFIVYIKEIAKILHDRNMRKIVNGIIPMYFETRWLGAFNTCNFIMKKKEILQNFFQNIPLPFFEDISIFTRGISILVQFIMYNERNNVNLNNIFPLCSQLLLFLRIVQNNSEINFPYLVDFFSEISYEVFKNFFFDEKGEINMVAYSLTPHGRNSLKRGFNQWGPKPADIYSGKYFNNFEFFFSPGKIDSYAYGNLEVNEKLNESLKVLVSLESEDPEKPIPYFSLILGLFPFIQYDFQNNLNPFKEASNCSSSNSNHLSSSTILSKKHSANYPFDTIIYTPIRQEYNSKKFLLYKGRLSFIFSSSLPNLPIVPKSKSKNKKQEMSKLTEIIIKENKKSKGSKKKKKKINLIKMSKNKRKRISSAANIYIDPNDEGFFGEREEELLFTSKSTNSTSELPKYSKRLSSKRKLEDFLYDSDFSDEENTDTLEEEFVFLGTDESNENSSECTNNKEEEIKTSSSLNTNSIVYPSTEECNNILRLPRIEGVRNSYFAPLLETCLAAKGTVSYHRVKEGDNPKKRILETLLLLPLDEILPVAFENLMRKVFMLNEMELRKTSECYRRWLSLEEEDLPSHKDLTKGHEYWNCLHDEISGWNYLSKMALLFSNTLPSESDVERDFSRGKYLTGERRFRNSRESMDAELILQGKKNASVNLYFKQ
jgi:hypothetical protein